MGIVRCTGQMQRPRVSGSEQKGFQKQDQRTLCWECQKRSERVGGEGVMNSESGTRWAAFRAREERDPRVPHSHHVLGCIFRGSTDRYPVLRVSVSCVQPLPLQLGSCRVASSTLPRFLPTPPHICTLLRMFQLLNTDPCSRQSVHSYVLSCCSGASCHLSWGDRHRLFGGT